MSENQTNNETPREKAERLGVPLRYTPPIRKQEPNPLQGQRQDGIKSYLNLIVSVCETCGKELTRQQEKPCGNMGCPFGEMYI